MPHRIRRITLFQVKVPIPVERVNDPQFPESLNRGPSGRFEDGEYFGKVPFYVIKVEGDGGPAGWGDTTRMARPERLAPACRAMLGLGPDEITGLSPLLKDRMNRLPADTLHHHASGNGWGLVRSCKGLETAIYDWTARCKEVPLHKLFGTQVRDRVRVEYWSGFRTPPVAAKIAKQAKNQGFLGLKLKAHLTLDVEGISKAVREACGADFHLTIDPNGRWETLENALPRARAMAEANPAAALEDPIYSAYEPLAEIRRQTGIEMFITVSEPKLVQEAMALKAADGFNVGGMWHQIREVSDAIHQAGSRHWLGSAVESGLSDLASAHMACTLPACTLGSDLIGHHVREDDLLRQPLPVERGFVVIPDGPGMGIDTDEEAVHRYSIAEPIVIE